MRTLVLQMGMSLDGLVARPLHVYRPAPGAS
jgi:hypothetical protein